MSASKELYPTSQSDVRRISPRCGISEGSVGVFTAHSCGQKFQTVHVRLVLVCVSTPLSTSDLSCQMHSLTSRYCCMWSYLSCSQSSEKFITIQIVSLKNWQEIKSLNKTAIYISMHAWKKSLYLVSSNMRFNNMKFTWLSGCCILPFSWACSYLGMFFYLFKKRCIFLSVHV